jgi:O-methyltransferase
MARLLNWLRGRTPHRAGALAEQMRKEGLTYLSPAKLARIEAEMARLDAGQVPGVFMEFGLALGGSGILIARQAVATGRQFAGFDVFGMIPPPTSDKDDAKSRQRYSVISSGQAKGLAGETYYGYVDDLLARVTASFARHGVVLDGEQVDLVKGLFEDTWPSQPVRPIALAHIDCDWYDPVKFCLGVVADRLSVGGAIVLDDYHDYGGCKVATEEFLAARPEFARVEGDNLILRRMA